MQPEGLLIFSFDRTDSEKRYKQHRSDHGLAGKHACGKKPVHWTLAGLLESCHALQVSGCLAGVGRRDAGPHHGIEAVCIARR